jgi:5-methylcytosine-specific restriction protein B
MDEAIDLVEGWRSQLLRAVDLLSQLLEVADDSAYLDLENALHAEAPDLIYWPWVHKYLCIGFPNRLDQFHVLRQQQCVLGKSGESLVGVGQRRSTPYQYADRFVRMARELAMPMNHLCLSLEASFEGGPS